MSESNAPFDVVVVGSCVVDFISYVPHLPRMGETVIGRSFEQGFGGKGANQLVAAAKLGSRTAIVAKLGNDSWGQSYKRHLDELGVDTSNTMLVEGLTTGIAQINVANNGDNQIVVVLGANAQLSIDDVSTYRSAIDRAKVLVCQIETPLKTTFAALRGFNGISILNASPVPSENNLEIYTLPTILCVNEIEAAAMTNRPVPNIDEAKRALTNFLDLGCRNVVITLGKDGALFGSSGEKAIHVKLPPGTMPVDTTGAGDAFIGALAHFSATEPDVPMVQKVGAACLVATMSVMKKGTQSSYPAAKDLVDFDVRTHQFIWNYLD